MSQTSKFYKIDSKFMKEKVLEISSTSGVNSNMLLIYQIFANIVSDIYCLDYSNVENFKLATMDDSDVHFGVTRELMSKLHKLKQIGVSSYGVVMPYIDNATKINEKREDDETFEYLKDISGYDTKKYDESFIEDLLSGFDSQGSALTGSESKLSVIGEILCAVLFDFATSAYIGQEARTDLADEIANPGNRTIKMILEENTRTEKKKVENFLLRETGLIFKYAGGFYRTSPISSQQTDLNDPDSTDKSWLAQKMSFTNESGNFKNNALGNIGKTLIVNKTLSTEEVGSQSRFILPLETKEVSRYNERYIAGPDYFLDEMFRQVGREDTDAKSFKVVAENISKKLTSFSEELIKKLNLDFKEDVNETAGLSIHDSGEYSAYHLFRKICYNAGEGLEELAEGIKEDTNDFQHALVLYLLILSGEDYETAEDFGIMQYWSNCASDDGRAINFRSANGDITSLFEPDGTSFLWVKALRICKTLIQNQLGQETVHGSDETRILEGHANVVEKNKISPKKVTIGKLEFEEQSPLAALTNDGDSVNNVWNMSLVGFCNKEAIKDDNDGYKDPTGEDESITGLTYSSTSAYSGPMRKLKYTNFVEDILFYPEEHIVEGGFATESEYGTAFGQAGIAYEDHGRSLGPIGFNHAQIHTICFFFVTFLLNQTLSASLEISKGGNNREKYEFNFSENQILGVVDALKREPNTDKMENENYLKSYNAAKAIIDSVSEIIVQKSNKILNRISGLLSIANDIVEVANSYSRYFDLSNTQNQDPKTRTLIDFMAKSNLKNLNEIFSFMNEDSLETYSKSIDSFLASSESNPVFAPNNNITDRQIKLMTLALSRRGYGYYSDENHGKKTILNIGIPTGLISYLRKKAYVDSTKESVSESPDASYLNSDFICIQVFKNSLSPETVTYYPKTFIFDIKKFTIENNNNIKVDQIENYLQSWQYEDLRNNFTFISYDKNNNPVKKTGKQILNQASSSNKEIIKQLIDNHIASHYLKMYQQTTLGIDMNEYAFPVSFTAYNENNEPYNLALNSVDSNVEGLYDLFESYLIRNYPSANLDPDLNFEFDRIRSQIKDSLFFKCQNKAKLLLSPKCFDRTFSILINEDDFIIDTDQLSSDLAKIDYIPFPDFTFDGEVLITQTVNITNDYESTGVKPNPDQQHREIQAHRVNAKGGDVPTIQQYVCNISLLKSF